MTRSGGPAEAILAAGAVTLSARRAAQRGLTVAFAAITLVLAYTTFDNVIERPDGVKIAVCFITAILMSSFFSRVARSFELRVTDVAFDDTAQLFLRDCARRTIRLVANDPDARDAAAYRDKIRETVHEHDLLGEEDIILVDVTVTDPSDFETRLDVHRRVVHGQFRLLTCSSSSVANALAALLLQVRDKTGAIPHIYFDWTQGSPVVNLLRLLLLGVGEVAPVTREVLRRAERDRRRRPHVHVG